MAGHEPLVVVRCFNGSEEVCEQKKQVMCLGQILLRVTPLVEEWHPLGFVLGFKGFRKPLQELIQNTLDLLRGKVDTVMMVGGEHKDFCKARLQWLELKSSNRKRMIKSEYIEWWPHDLMMQKYQQIPVDVLVQHKKELSFFHDCGVFLWGDLEKIQSRSKRGRLQRYLPLWCQNFPQTNQGWRVLPFQESLEVTQNFDPPLQQHDALVFLLAPLCDRLCAQLRLRSLAMTQMRLDVKYYKLPAQSDLDYESKNKRRGEWAKSITFQTPMVSSKSLQHIVLHHLKVLQGPYELCHLSLHALKTTPLTVHQGHLWHHDETTLKMPLWLEEMQQQLGGRQVGFLQPTVHRSPLMSHELTFYRDHNRDMNTRDMFLKTQPPLRWLKRKMLVSINDLSGLSLFFTHQEQPAFLDVPGISYYRAWLSDMRQVLCRYELEEDQWWLYAFFD